MKNALKVAAFLALDLAEMSSTCLEFARKRVSKTFAVPKFTYSLI
jgi:hypothetical protein